MANTKEILPNADYKVKTVGPSREWSFDGNNGKVEMTTDSIQFEGHENMWVDVNRARTSDAPKEGDTLTGSIEQDEAGKYPPKFKKERKGGGGWGGGGGRGASAGAIWSSAVETAVQVVNAYIEISGKKPKSIDEYLARVEQTAPKVNAIVDRLKDANKSSDSDDSSKPATESGESESSGSGAKKADVVVEDIDDEELGSW